MQQLLSIVGGRGPPQSLRKSYLTSIAGTDRCHWNPANMTTDDSIQRAMCQPRWKALTLTGPDMEFGRTGYGRYGIHDPDSQILSGIFEGLINGFRMIYFKFG